MAERTIFYWSKMYTSQIKSGDTYDKLKKCVTINIVDFKCTPLKKLYSSYHITEDETGYRLTDIFEVHFLEIPKLFDNDIERDENDPVVQWMEFLDARSKGVIEMLAEKMLRQGDSIEDIIDITELPKDKILELKRKYQN
jgi:predicted transposase/invertase (TIGR01784 family)